MRIAQEQQSKKRGNAAGTDDSTADAGGSRAAGSVPSSNRLRGRRRQRKIPRTVEPLWTFRQVVWTTLAFVGLTMIAVTVSFIRQYRNGDASTSATRAAAVGAIFASVEDIPTQLINSLDAILVLGGGVPASLEEPPLYVQRRLDDAAAVVSMRKQGQSSIGARGRIATSAADRPSLPILCLSAGTAHRGQLLSPLGLPIWESTSSAAYLARRHHISTNVYLETTSYDTIGNAFFARTSHTDIVDWKRLLIVTNEFHMARSRAIFDWIYGIENNSRKNPYQLYYLSSQNVGLSPEAVNARKQREDHSLQSVNKLSQQYTTLAGVWEFLNTKHDLYAAPMLVERANGKGGDETGESAEVIKSYGAS